MLMNFVGILGRLIFGICSFYLIQNKSGWRNGGRDNRGEQRWQVVWDLSHIGGMGYKKQELGCIKRSLGIEYRYLCAWGNDAANEVITEARQLLVENYFQTPSLA
ncbi:hypothetical protein QVD17_37283 [Tagetes erecta]|uniref:Uncharacterized protein n=1 Tax=Tagetes erecta TaxID=13708 RepID=A0AAD8JW77_TARER|nr:hypothetical protein QVD17_37283 [Tagetes erecta]